MFTNLIESDSHHREFKRRSSFFLVTTVTYALILFVAGIGSIYAYDARLEAQSTSLELLNWVPPVASTPERTRDTRPQPVRRAQPSNAPVDRSVTVPMRTEAVAPPTDPTKVPDHIGTTGGNIPPVTGPYVLGNKNVDPPSLTNDNPNGCLTCNSSGPIVKLDDEKPPPPAPVKPQTQKLTSFVLASKAVSLPQPPYPPMALQIRAQGAVNVQILVDEQGKVVSAQAINGHPMLVAAAKEAALRARFTPTILNGQPVKVQGVITYNFVLQ
jgi:periplasmic protein TonB